MLCCYFRFDFGFLFVFESCCHWHTHVAAVVERHHHSLHPRFQVDTPPLPSLRCPIRPVIACPPRMAQTLQPAAPPEKMTVASAPRMQTPAAKLQTLPDDVQQTILSHLSQRELGILSTSCHALNALSAPLLQRTFRCVSCTHQLFHPRDILPLPMESRRRRAFFELRIHARHAMVLDHRRGAANFHVLRHLSQTVFKNVRFPLPRQLQAVRALRCPQCAVFVGFRHDGVTGVPREYVHQEFVELVDLHLRVVSLAGVPVSQPEGIVRCANSPCRAVLFQRDDILPWTHVLASSRLTDMDAYLEWDHSWAGAATASQPAFFVKRLRNQASRVDNIRTERLRQGLMQVGDVHCGNCDAHIGWKILAEVPQSSEGLLLNYDQIGRFGIIRTAVAPSEPRYLI